MLNTIENKANILCMIQHMKWKKNIYKYAASENCQTKKEN